jgi:hypothetical protein
MSHEASDDVNATMSGAGTLSSPCQKLLRGMSVVLANVDYFEELSARLQAHCCGRDLRCKL